MHHVAATRTQEQNTTCTTATRLHVWVAAVVVAAAAAAALAADDPATAAHTARRRGAEARGQRAEPARVVDRAAGRVARGGIVDEVVEVELHLRVGA